MDNNEQNIPAVSGNVEAGQVSSDAGAQVSGEGMTPIGNGDIGTAEPEMGTMANLAAEKEEAPAEEVTASKTGVVLSSKQSAVISERKDLYKRMVNSYAERFADQAKAPKAKMTDAAHVLKVMREAEKSARNGAKAAGAELDEANEAGQNARDEAYEKAIVRIMDHNAKGSKTAKAKKMPKNSLTQKAWNMPNRPSIANNVRMNSSQVEPLLSSFDTMMSTAKGLIDTMGNMSKNLVRQLAKTDNVAGLGSVTAMANNGLAGNRNLVKNFNTISKPLAFPKNTASIIRNNNGSVLPISSAAASAKPKTKTAKKRKARGLRTSKKAAKKNNDALEAPSLSTIVEEGPNNFTNL